jgi:predicted sulfurtransferase
VLTDGLPAPLDWRNAGRDLPAAAWHAELASLPTDAVVLDCRNDFESALGSFAQAEPLGTQAFSQSWDALRSRLASTPRDAPIYTFCTGGIRCVKVNAWLEAEMGFNNTARLRDGIHGYMRFVEAEAERQARSPAELSHWRGANFVFYKGSPRVLGDNNLEAAEGQRGPGAAEAAGAGVHDLTLEDDSRW